MEALISILISAAVSFLVADLASSSVIDKYRDEINDYLDRMIGRR